MALTNMKFVYRDGTNSPTDPINGYQVMDSTSEQWPGIAGDLLYERSSGKFFIHHGTGHYLVYPQSAPFNVIHYNGSGTYYLSDANDVLSIYNPTGESIVNLHEVTTAKVKPYYIKNWFGYAIRIRAYPGNVIEVHAQTEIVLQPTASVTLVPLVGHPYWVLL